MDDAKPTSESTPPPPPSGWRAVGPMLLVVTLTGGGLWAFKKYGAKALTAVKNKNLSVEETLNLGDRRFISIVQADGERFLLALSPQSIQLLARLQSADELQGLPLPEGQTHNPAFENNLKQEMSQLTAVKLKDMEAKMRGEG